MEGDWYGVTKYQQTHRQKLFGDMFGIVYNIVNSDNAQRIY